jgi:hypothetical protein
VKFFFLMFATVGRINLDIFMIINTFRFKIINNEKSCLYNCDVCVILLDNRCKYRNTTARE